MLRSRRMASASVAIILFALGSTMTLQAAQIKIACIQMPVSNSIETNTANIIAHLRAESAQSTRVAVFPECSISGYDAKIVPTIPQATVDAAVARIAAVCAERRIYAICGTTWLDEGVRKNAAIVLGPDGKLVYRFFKMHVVEDYNKDGDRLAIFKIDGVPATLFVCHDQRYPELMRIPVLGGARVAFYISFESPASSGKNFNYRCQIVGRAIENQTWVVHCNAPAGNECGESHGQSRIIAPDGTIKEEANDGEAVIRHVVDTDQSSRAWVEAGAARAPFDGFWLEGLRILQSQNPDVFAGVTATPRLLPDVGRRGDSPNARLQIACSQIAATDDVGANEAGAIVAIEREAAQHSRVIVLPEGALTGRVDGLPQRMDQAAVDAAVARIADACRARKVYCIIGSAFRDRGKIYNGAYVIDPAGSVIKRYAQIQPDRPDVFAGGDRLALFTIDKVYATVTVGHDIHFPEFSRIAALGGAKIYICLAHERAGASVAAAESQVVCRSVESQMFTVWCNAGKGGRAGDSTGHSRIVSPSGRVLAEASEAADAAIHATVATAQASYHVPRAGARTPSLTAFWQEGLDILRAGDPEFYSSTAATEPAPKQDWRQRFVQPSPEFTQMPFWFWNDRLSDDEIKRQMADFREHGVYGFVIHHRMGLPKDMPYMGEQWLHFVHTAVEEAARTNMRVCLYDEAMYPSGSAHGEVVAFNPAFAAQGLTVVVKDVTGPSKIAKPSMTGAGYVATVLGRHDVGKDAIDPDSLRLLDGQPGPIDVPAGDWRVMTFTQVPSQGQIRGVFEGEEENEPGAPKAADLLNPEAMKTFIRLAYEPCYRRLKEHYGRCIIGVFTDEPSMLGRRPLRGLKPWTGGLATYFERKRGYSPLALLPGLFFDIGGKTTAIRQDYDLTLQERLEETYYVQLSHWCEQHGIALTGHPAGATEIQPMRHFQIPGQDIVWRGVAPDGGKALEGTNSAIAKCSSSVARHDGRPRNSNEVFGAFGWQLTMEEMKWMADWLMVRGVNLLYPHAFYYSIRDYRVNERPPDVGPHNAWWPHYRLFADYTARLCSLLADSQQVCGVAILGANHHLPWRAARFLYRNQVDFNYLDEWRLLQQARFAGGRMMVGPMAYSLIIVDQDAPPTGAVAERLKAFESASGKVRYCTGEPSAGLLDGLVRDIQAGPAADDLRYTHVVKDDVHFYLLVNEGDQPIATRITVRCRGRAEWFNAWEGKFSPATIVETGASTMTVQLSLERRGSAVLCIDPGGEAQGVTGATVTSKPADRKPLAGPWMVLDTAGKQVANHLGDWLGDRATSTYSGTMRYQTSFEFSVTKGMEYAIDLGRLGDFATVTLNGRPLPAKFWTPYRWSVTDLLRDGRNNLAVDVTNSLVNKYDAKIRRASGLLGPVEIVSMTQGNSSQSSASMPATASQAGHRVRVAAIQMLPATGDPTANIQRAEGLIRRAVKEHGSQVLVLPECTLTGYTNPSDGKLTLEQTRELAEPVPGPSVEHFAGLARELGVYIVWGLHERRGDRYYNSAVLLSHQGHIEGTYSKVHINKYEGKMGWTNGDKFQVWPCRLGDITFNIGIMICFDREVPESARCLAMLGADLVLVPQATSCTAVLPIHRDQLRVRAYENEVYLAMANWGGPVFKGHSMIIAPTGEVLKLGSLEEEILAAELDLDALRKLRANGIYGRHHRQPGAYGPLKNGPTRSDTR